MPTLQMGKPRGKVLQSLQCGDKKAQWLTPGSKQPGARTASSPGCVSSVVCLPESLSFLIYHIMSLGYIKLLRRLADIENHALLSRFLPQPFV